MLDYKPTQYCNIKTHNCEYHTCCYECEVEVCEYRCHLYDHKDYETCKHGEKIKITLD